MGAFCLFAVFMLSFVSRRLHAHVLANAAYV